MACTSVTVAPIKPTISNIAATDKGSGNVSVAWNQDIPGSVAIKMDGSTLQTIQIGVAGSQQVMLSNVSAGSHNICVEAV